MQQTTICPAEETGMLPARPLRVRLFWLSTYAYASVLLIHIFVTFTGLTLSATGGFQQVMEGSGYRPYVTRALVPMLIRGVSRATPEGVKDLVLHVLGGRGFMPEFYLRGYSFEKVVFLVVAWAMFLATAYMFRALAKHYFRISENMAGVVGVASLMTIPLLFRYFNYIYDPATIFFSTLLLLLLARRKTALFFLAFALACINKETTVLTVPIFLAFYWESKWTAAAGSTVLAVIWGAIRLSLKHQYAGNPGMDVERHFWDHTVRVLTNYPVSFCYAVVVVGVLASFAVHRWNSKPRQLRAGLLLTLPPLIASAIAFGFVEETRAYYDAYPYLFLLAVAGVLSWTGEGDGCLDDEARLSTADAVSELPVR